MTAEVLPAYAGTHAGTHAGPESDAVVGAGPDLELACVDTFAVTHDVRSFVLEGPAGPGLVFRPGQHVTVHVEVDGVPLQRCYTIASSPTRPGRVTITVKRLPGGPVSGWLHDHLGIGDRLRVSGPAGRFSTHEHPAAKHLFLSAGSGITPLMSMTRELHDRPGEHDVAFVHSARTPDDIVFRGELEAMAAQHDWLGLTVFCEADSPGETWAGPRGRLDLAALVAAVPDLAEREVFVCGPQPYMEAVAQLLAAAGADPDRCHRESFVLAGPLGPSSSLGSSSPPAGSAPATDEGYAMEFRRTGRVVRCAPGSTVLEAALAAGVSLPSSCGEGMCGTCITTLLGGDVDMQHAGGIRAREIAAAKILPCCSVPLDDLVLDA